MRIARGVPDRGHAHVDQAVGGLGRGGSGGCGDRCIHRLVSPAAAPASSGTRPGLSIIAPEICFVAQKRQATKGADGEDELRGSAKITSSFAGLLALLLSLAPAPVRAQAAPGGTPPSWLDPALLPAAKAEGSLVVYSSTNEQEGLPLFKLFTDATGIKVEYVRASDAVLMSRMAIEFRADTSSYDI